MKLLQLLIYLKVALMLCKLCNLKSAFKNKIKNKRQYDATRNHKWFQKKS